MVLVDPADFCGFDPPGLDVPLAFFGSFLDLSLVALAFFFEEGLDLAVGFFPFVGFTVSVVSSVLS